MRASLLRRSSLPSSWRSLPFVGSVVAVVGALAVSVMVGIPGTFATAAPPASSPLATKKYWHVALGSFPAQPPVWWRLSDYTLDTRDGRSGSVTAYEREWQQRQDVVPARKRIGVITNCNPAPVGKESKDCEFYHTLPTAVRTRKGSFTYRGNAQRGTLVVTWTSQSDHQTPAPNPTTPKRLVAPGGKPAPRPKTPVVAPKKPVATPKKATPVPKKSVVTPKKPAVPAKPAQPLRQRQDNPANAVTSETWAITLQRNGLLGAAKLQSTVPDGASTEGRAYGSSQDFSNYYSAEEIEGIDDSTPAWYGSSRVMERGALLNWRRANMPISPLQRRSSDGQSLYWSDDGSTKMSSLFVDEDMRVLGPGNGCKQGQEDMKGMNNYLWVSEKSRYMVWQSHKRCLTARGTAPYVDGPGFKAGMHIEMLVQILDDEGSLVGALGGEASSSGMYKGKGWGAFGIHDVVNPPW